MPKASRLDTLGFSDLEPTGESSQLSGYALQLFGYCQAPVFVVREEQLLWQCNLTECQNVSKIGRGAFFWVSSED